MAAFNLFGRKKEAPAKADASRPAMPDLDLPPPPAPSPQNIPQPEPQKPVDREVYEKNIELPVLDNEKVSWPGQDQGDIPGLDKEWLEFAKNATEQGEEIPEEAPAPEPPPEEIPKPALQAKREKPQREMPKAAPKPEVLAKADAEGDYFVDIATYQGLTNGIEDVAAKIHMLEGLFSKLNAMREKEDMEIKRWHQGFDDMRKKLLFVDDALFESKR